MAAPFMAFLCFQKHTFDSCFILQKKNFLDMRVEGHMFALGKDVDVMPITFVLIGVVAGCPHSFAPHACVESDSAVFAFQAI